MKSRGIEPKRMLYVCVREGGKPYLIMVEGTLGGREGIEVLTSVVNG